MIFRLDPGWHFFELTQNYGSHRHRARVRQRRGDCPCLCCAAGRFEPPMPIATILYVALSGALVTVGVHVSEKLQLRPAGSAPPASVTVAAFVTVPIKRQPSVAPAVGSYAQNWTDENGLLSALAGVGLDDVPVAIAVSVTDVGATVREMATAAAATGVAYTAGQAAPTPQITNFTGPAPARPVLETAVAVGIEPGTIGVADAVAVLAWLSTMPLAVFATPLALTALPVPSVVARVWIIVSTGLAVKAIACVVMSVAALYVFTIWSGYQKVEPPSAVVGAKAAAVFASNNVAAKAPGTPG